MAKDYKCKDFIIYLDDNNEQIKAFVNIQELNQSFVTFSNRWDRSITIPVSRMIKIKHNVTNEGSHDE